MPAFVLAMGLLVMTVPFAAAAPSPGGAAAIGAGKGFYGDVTVPGEVWEPCAPAGISALDVEQIEAAGTSTAYAVIDNTPGKVIKTTDYGDNWQIIDLAAGFGWTEHISVVDAQTVWVGSVHNREEDVAITTDGGGSWVYAYSQPNQADLEATSSLHAWAAGNFYGGGGCFIRETFNGGADWSQVYGNAGSCYDVESTDSNNIWAVGSISFKGWIAHWDGSSWNFMTPDGLGTQELRGCWTLDSNNAWAVGGNKIIRTADGGDNWEVYTAPDGVDGLKDICALSPVMAFAVGSYGAIIKTTDGGENWTRMYVPTGEHLQSVYAVDPTHAWAVGTKGTVLRLVQANTREGSDITVGLGGGDSITFSSVTAAGNTIKSPTEEPTGEEFDYHLPVRWYDISTSASFSGTAEVRLSYGDDYGFDEEGYRLLHKTGGGWEDVTTGVDTENNVISGRVTSLSDFAIIYPLPKIKSITPDWGMRGNTYDVDINGYGFWEKVGEKPDVKLKLGETTIDAADVVVHDLYHISCRFHLPEGATLDFWEVYVKDPSPDDYENTFWGFRIVENPPPPPTIASITPSYGARGTAVNISDLAGTGFWYTPAVKPTVKLTRSGQPDISAKSVVVYSGTKIKCTFDIPPDAYSGPWDVTVVNPDGQSGTKAGCFMVTGGLPAPTIDSVTPDWGVLGTTVTVTISGTGFWGSPFIAILGSDPGQNAIWATNIAVQSDTTITCDLNLIANRKPGTYDMLLRNQDNQEVTKPGAFAINSAAPAIASLSPSNGHTGTEVTITGTAFGASRWDSYVSFGGVQATEYTSWSATLIRAKVPAGATGTVDVKVITDWGTSNGVAFTVFGNPPPTVTSITPNSGAQGSSVAVTDLAGSGFYGTPTVKLKRTGQPDITATGVTAQSPTRITCNLPIPPEAATGAWDVVVKNPDNQEAALVGGFTVTSGGSGGNTPAGSDVEVDLGGGVEAAFSGVSGGGNTTATPQPDPSVANYHILGGSCYDITTTATYTGTILVTLPYDEAALTVPEKSLRILHREGGEWVDVTRSVDTAQDRITGEVTSLSPFAIGWKAANVWYLAEGCTEGGMKTWVLV
ncbi:MAG: IPT/TIG domain-containing protein, partial [Actinomycetota bacterium]|nr:IPT/TIG domain-containing protein [Actinomycetota bacterium]